MSISLCDTPLTIVGDLELKNRVVLAPLTRGRSGTDQCPKQHSVDYYVQRAGAGLLISEGTIPSQQGMGWSGAPAIYSPEHVAAWRKVTDAMHAAGSKTHSSFHGLQPASASAIGVEGNAWCLGKTKKPYEVPRALEAAEIPRVVEELRHAAACAKEAGFDGVELHGANGYLIDQFLQSCSNKRTDDYGGSPEKRFRLLREVIAAVSTVFPPSRIGVRLSPNGAFNGMGSPDNVETFTYVITQLDALGLMYLHVMVCTHNSRTHRHTHPAGSP